MFWPSPSKLLALKLAKKQLASETRQEKIRLQSLRNKEKEINERSRFLRAESIREKEELFNHEISSRYMSKLRVDPANRKSISPIAENNCERSGFYNDTLVQDESCYKKLTAGSTAPTDTHKITIENTHTENMSTVRRKKNLPILHHPDSKDVLFIHLIAEQPALQSEKSFKKQRQKSFQHNRSNDFTPPPHQRVTPDLTSFNRDNVSLEYEHIPQSGHIHHSFRDLSIENRKYLNLLDTKVDKMRKYYLNRVKPEFKPRTSIDKTLDIEKRKFSIDDAKRLNNIPRVKLNFRGNLLN